MQGPGGNVPLKRDGPLWVGASGTWLAEAERRPILLPVRLAPLLEAAAVPPGRARDPEAWWEGVREREGTGETDR